MFNPGVAYGVSNGPSEKKRAVSISQLFQKKRLCLNPHIADIERKHQQQQEQERDEDMLKEHDEEDDEEDESQHSDSVFGVQHDDNSIVLNESVDDGPNMSTDDAANPELYCSNEEEDYDTFTVSQKSVVKLLYLLDQMEAPDYAFQSIMKWASECYQEGFDFNPQSKTRKANISWMYRSIHNATSMMPTSRQITLPQPLPGMNTMGVICYDFVAQLLSLLQDKSLMTEKNLLLDPKDPLAMFKPADGKLGEALSGSMYREMYKALVTDPTRQLLVPLATYIDGTTIDTLSRFVVEPYTFVPLIFNYKRRCRADIWRPFGYVEQLNSKVTSTEHKLTGAHKVRNYHAQLSGMLKGLRNVQMGQDPRLRDVEIFLFGEVKRVEVICPILFISADTPAADKLCGHFSNFAGIIRRPTTACDINAQAMDNPYHNCNFVKWDAMNAVARNGTKEERKVLSQHKLDNAFSDILLGNPMYKIYGALPTDPMHSVRKGLIQRTAEQINECMTEKQQNDLDLMAKTFHMTHRQTARRDFPKTDFQNGVTKLSLLTAEENVGSLYLLTCMAQFEDGWNLLNTALLNREKNQKKKKGKANIVQQAAILDKGKTTNAKNGNKTNLKKKGKGTNLKEVLETLEALCCFDAWTRLDNYWKLEEEDVFSQKAHDAICKLLHMITTRLPREKGCGWKLVTFHNITHIVSDMKKFGSPKGINTEIGEKNHKYFAKSLGRSARKQHSTFTKQVSQRLSDAFIMRKMASLMGEKVWGEDDGEDTDGSDSDSEDGKKAIEESTQGATLFSVFECKKDGVSVQWTSKTEETLLRGNENKDVMQYILDVYKEEHGVETVHCCTQYKRDKLVMRCHPNYQGEGPWYDWIVASFAAGKCEGVACPAGPYPCKLLAIIPQQHNEFLEETELIVLPALKPSRGGDSVLFKEWIMAKNYVNINVSSVLSSPFVLEIGKGKVSVAVPYAEWPSQFTDTSY